MLSYATLPWINLSFSSPAFLEPDTIVYEYGILIFVNPTNM